MTFHLKKIKKWKFYHMHLISFANSISFTSLRKRFCGIAWRGHRSHRLINSKTFYMMLSFCVSLLNIYNLTLTFKSAHVPVQGPTTRQLQMSYSTKEVRKWGICPDSFVSPVRYIYLSSKAGVLL